METKPGKKEISLNTIQTECPKDDSSMDSDSGPDDRNPPPSKKDKSKDKSGKPMENGEPT